MRSQRIGQGSESPYLHQAKTDWNDVSNPFCFFASNLIFAALLTHRYVRQDAFCRYCVQKRCGASLRSLHATHRSGGPLPEPQKRCRAKNIWYIVPKSYGRGNLSTPYGQYPLISTKQKRIGTKLPIRFVFCFKFDFCGVAHASPRSLGRVFRRCSCVAKYA